MFACNSELAQPDASQQNGSPVRQGDRPPRRASITSQDDASRCSSISFLRGVTINGVSDVEVAGVDAMIASAINSRIGASLSDVVRSSLSLNVETPTRAVGKNERLSQRSPQSPESIDERPPSVISSTHVDMRATDGQQPRSLVLNGLKGKRMSVLGLRLSVQEQRDVVKRRRVALMDHDAQLLQQMRKLALASSAAAISELLEPLAESQKAREELQALETAYDAMEDELIRAEWDMKEAETKAYDSGFLIEAFPTSKSHTPSRSDSFVSSIDGVTNPAAGYQAALKKRYLSRKGDAALLLEELGELQADRARYVEDERVLELVGLEVSSEGQQILKTFDARHGELLATLKRVQEDIADLHEKVINQDDRLFKAHVGQSFDDLDPGFKAELLSADDIDLALTIDSLPGMQGDRVDQADSLLQPEAALDFIIYALEKASEWLVSADDVIDHEFVKFFYTSLDDRLSKYSEVGLKPNGTICTYSFINRWLENILRRSRLECVTLFDSATYYNPGVPYDKLAELCQSYWQFDRTAPRHARNSSLSTKSLPAASENKATVRSVRSDSNIARQGRLQHRFQRNSDFKAGPRMNSSLTILPRLRRPLLRRLSRKSRIKDLDKSISAKTSP